MFVVPYGGYDCEYKITTFRAHMQIFFIKCVFFYNNRQKIHTKSTAKGQLYLRISKKNTTFVPDLCA